MSAPAEAATSKAVAAAASAAAAAAATAAPAAAASTPPSIVPNSGGKAALDKAYTVDWTNMIGRGAVGKVFRAVRVADGKVVAVKSIDVGKFLEDTTNKYEHLHREISVHKWASSTPWRDGIVKFYEAFEDAPSMMYNVLELVGGGTLNSEIVNHARGMGEVRARKLLFQMLRTLAFMQQNKLVHRDLKPDNLMLERSEGEGGLEVVTTKLIDFGYSRETVTMTDGTVVGTVEYVAPEVLYGRTTHAAPRYDDRVDMWSAGCIAYEMITGTRPFGDRYQIGGQAALFSKARAGNYNDPAVDRASTAFSTMLRSTMLVPDWHQRKHAVEVLEDPWFGLPAGADLSQPLISRLTKIEVENTNIETLASLRDMLKKHLGASGIECSRCDHTGLKVSYDATAKSSLIGGAQANERVFFWSPKHATAAVMIDAAENGIEACSGKLEFFASPNRGSCCVQRNDGKFVALACKVMLGPNPIAAQEGDENNAAFIAGLPSPATSFYIGSGEAKKVYVLNELVVLPYALFAFTRA